MLSFYHPLRDRPTIGAGKPTRRAIWFGSGVDWPLAITLRLIQSRDEHCEPERLSDPVASASRSGAPIDWIVQSFGA